MSNISLPRDSGFFETILDQSNEMICCHAPNGIYTYANRAAERLTGYTVEELIGNNPYDFFHPDDRDYIQEQGHKPSLAGDDSTITEYRFRHKNGQYVWFQTSTKPVLDEEGNLKYLITSSRQIDQLVQLRNKLESSTLLLEEASRLTTTGAWEVELDPFKISWSKVTYQIHNIPEDQSPELEDALSFFPDKYRTMVDEAVQKSIEFGTPYNLEVEFIARGGERKWVRTICKPEMRYGKVVKLIGVFQDITRDVKQRQQLRDLADFLTQKKMQLESFNQIVSHNLRSPVANLTALVKFYKDSDDPEERKTFINFIQESTENLQALLGDLVDAVKVMNADGIDRKECHIGETFHKIKTSFQGQIMALDAKIELTTCEWQTIKYSEIYLDSILTNFISNALKYGRENVPPVIELQAVMLHGHHALRIIDNGSGIDLKRHGHKIFNLHKTFHPTKKGKGLGLFMTRQQIEALGGEVKVESELGKGSIFTVIFDKYSDQL